MTLLGFESQKSVWRKLGTTFVLLLMAIFAMLATFSLWDKSLFPFPGWFRACCLALVEMIWTFIVLAIVFVWWQPKWLRDIYEHAERRMRWLYIGVPCGLALLLVLAAVHDWLGGV